MDFELTNLLWAKRDGPVSSLIVQGSEGPQRLAMRGTGPQGRPGSLKGMHTYSLVVLIQGAPRLVLQVRIAMCPLPMDRVR